MTNDDKREALKRFSPVAPPCFSSRDQWIDWMVMAERRPLILKAGRPVGINTAVCFCVDCTKDFKAAMKRVGRCDPMHLRKFKAMPA